MKTVLFIGLTDKIGLEPLDSSTNSGKLIDLMIAKLEYNCHKINLVNFAPIDSNGKLRYPDKSELDKGFCDLKKTIESLRPDLCVLLGNKVSDFLSDKQIGNSLKIKHPSYIYVYRRKYIADYVEESVQLILSKAQNDIEQK
jgi:uracil-DNA glycosylase